MLQRILDPSDATSAVNAVSFSILPHSARRFGFLPDISKLLPGDVVLSRATQSPQTLNPIAVSQTAAGFSPEHAQWTHAAVVLLEDMLVEAVLTQGVIQRTIYTDVPNRISSCPQTSHTERNRPTEDCFAVAGDVGRAL